MFRIRNTLGFLAVLFSTTVAFSAEDMAISGLENTQPGKGTIGTCTISVGQISSDKLSSVKTVALQKDGGIRPIFKNIEGYIAVQNGELNQVLISVEDKSNTAFTAINNKEIRRFKGAYLMLQRQANWMVIDCESN